MFRTVPPTEPDAHDNNVPPAELVPLSHLELDLPAPPGVGGWPAYLAAKDIPIVLDDFGRSAISRDDARRLFDEHRENEARKAEMRAAAEQAAVESDQQWRAQIWTGVPAVDGVPAATLMLQASKDARPKWMSVLQESLAGEGMTYHALSSTPDED